MTEIKRIGIDTSKAVFTLHCINQADQPVLRVNLRRAQMLPFFKKHLAAEVAMEACASSHHWARKLTALGHNVRLIPPQYVKPFVKRAKNDRNDAEAICEAAGRPGMRFVLTKSAQQQAQGMVLKVRETLVGQRTQLANTLRGHAAEFGIIAAKGMSRIASLLEAIEAETTIPLEAREMLALLGQEIEHLDIRIREIETKLTVMHKANAISQLLATIPGVGPIIALTLALEVDPAAFQSGRHLAAWIGLTPKEHSTGGKQRMGGISRAGHERLRQLLVTGATSVIKLATRPGHRLATEWLLRLLQHKPRKLVAVALANKMARIAWARLAKVPGNRLRLAGRPGEGMMTSGEAYRHQSAAGAVSA